MADSRTQTSAFIWSPDTARYLSLPARLSLNRARAKRRRFPKITIVGIRMIERRWHSKMMERPA